MKIQKTAIIVLSLLLILSLGYIAFDKYNAKLASQQMLIYQQGLEQGYNQTVTSIFQEVSACRQLPVTMNNKTINLFAVECLQKG